MKKVRYIKSIHSLMMLIWPLLMVAIVLGDAYLSYVIPMYDSYAIVLLLMWLIYSYFLLSVTRGRLLMELIFLDGNLEGYRTSLRFLERFYVLPSSRVMQRVARIDGHLALGEFDEAYAVLRDLKKKYNSMPNRVKIKYDYYWCRFYADINDVKNFRICKETYDNHWVQSGAVQNPRLQGIIAASAADLTLRDDIFSGKGLIARNALADAYDHKLIRGRYEFMRYCYLMGLAELGLGEEQEAKHWFAQTVSIGFHEVITRNAMGSLRSLEGAGVPFAENPPKRSTYQELPVRRASISSCVLSILIALVFVLLVIFV